MSDEFHRLYFILHTNGGKRLDGILWGKHPGSCPSTIDQFITNYIEWTVNLRKLPSTPSNTEVLLRHQRILLIIAHYWSRTADPLGSIILCCGCCPMHHGILAASLVCTLEACSTSPVWQPKMSKHPLGSKIIPGWELSWKRDQYNHKWLINENE